MSLPPSPPWVDPPLPAHPPVPPSPAVAAPPQRGGLAWLLGFATLASATLAGADFAGAFGEVAAYLRYGFGHGSLLSILYALVVLVVSGLPYAIALAVFFLAHEFGHYIACRRYGVDATPPFFIPAPVLSPFGTLGAVIRIRSAIPSRRALFDIGIAGPLAGFVALLPALLLGVQRSRLVPAQQLAGGYSFGDSLLLSWVVDWLKPHDASMQLVGDPLIFAAWIGMLATAMNLIPAGQLDGGHIVYALSPRAHFWVGLFAGLFLASLVATRWLRFGQLSAWLLWAVIVFWFGRRHPPLPDDRLDGEELSAREALGGGRIALAIAAGVVLLLCFMPHPIEIHD